MAESNSFYQSPNLDLSGPGGSNQQSQLDQEDAEFNALLEQFSADGVITDEERAILGGASNGQGVQTQEPAKPVSPPATIMESIKQTYDESVLADLIGRGFGQEVFQSKAPDGTPTYSIYNKRFGTLGSQVPYSEASPEAQAQARKFMQSTGGQERPLPETPTSPVLNPEQVQSALDEQRAAQAAQFAQDLGTVPTIDPFTGQTIENPTPFDFNNDPSAGMTMNQQAIANALAGTNAQSQEEGQVRAAPPAQTLSQYLRYEDSPEQRTEQFVDEQGRLRLRPTPEAAQLQGLSDFVQPSLDEREMRLAERDRLPGETQTERDTRIAQSRTTGARTEGMSFDDAKRRAEGELVERGVRNPSSSQVNAFARLIQAQEPERLEALRIKTAKDLAKLNFEPKVVEVEGQKLIQLAPEYYQPVRDEPKEDEPFEPRILDHNNFIYFEIAPNRFERQPATGQTKEDILAEIKRRNEVMGATPADGNAEGDKKLYKETAQSILNEAGGDKEEARRIARERGFVL